jgi:hypothetical protein
VLPRHRRTPIRDIVRILKRYRRAHGRYPSLFRPQRFSEKIQWRKLFDPSPLYSVFCDKLACRDFIEARLGPGHLPPLLWSGDDPAALPLERLPVPFVVKCAHGSGMNVFVDDPTRADFVGIRAKLAAWQAQNFGRALQEPGYVPVPPRLLVEAMLTEDDGALPAGYKLFLFDGRVELIMVRINDGPDSHRAPTSASMLRSIGGRCPRPISRRCSRWLSGSGWGWTTSGSIFSSRAAGSWSANSPSIPSAA